MAQAWKSSSKPARLGGLLSHQNSVTQAGCLIRPTLRLRSAARSTVTILSRSGVEASYLLKPEVSGPPLVLIGW
jgi:hypothetical protein